MPLEIPIRYYDRDSNKVTIVDDAHENVAPPLINTPCDCEYGFDLFDGVVADFLEPEEVTLIDTYT